MSMDLYSRVKLRDSDGRVSARGGSKMSHLIAKSNTKATFGSSKNRNGGLKRTLMTNITTIATEGSSKDIRYEVGDMVWWKTEQTPGEILHEARALPSALRAKKKGHLLVSFYGDDTYRWLKPADLVPFDQIYHQMKRNIEYSALKTVVKHAAEKDRAETLKRGVIEAETEVMRRASLGLTCYCRNSENFRPTRAHGLIEVDIPGFGTSEYTVEQIEKARNNFVPSKTLSFVQELALTPSTDVRLSLALMKDATRVLTYRKAVFEEFDPTLAEAFASLRAEEAVDENMGKSEGLMEKTFKGGENEKEYYCEESSRDISTSLKQMGTVVSAADDSLSRSGKRVRTDNSANPRNPSSNVLGNSNVMPVNVSSPPLLESALAERHVKETGDYVGVPPPFQPESSNSSLRGPVEEIEHFSDKWGTFVPEQSPSGVKFLNNVCTETPPRDSISPPQPHPVSPRTLEVLNKCRAIYSAYFNQQ